jgi:hypothetical protein
MPDRDETINQTDEPHDPAEQGHQGEQDLPPNVQRERAKDPDDGDELVGSQR